MSGAVREFGKYQLIQRIARGGMAEIFLAAQPGPAGFERFMVIKRILPAFSQNEEFVRMFVDETRIAARLSHPNIGHVYDFGSIEGLYFIAMELIDGVNLRQLVLRGHPLPLEHAIRVIGYVCEALHYAHTLNDRSGKLLEIVHRDVTPQNIMVSFEGAVKLVDFGIAKATVQAEQTQAGILKGKFSYMSPEQVRGKTLDARSDVFSLGVLLYELVTGARLFVAETATDTMDAVTRCKVPRVDTIRANLPPGLQDVIDRAVVPDPDKRYSSARDMQLDLERVLLAGQLVSNSILLAEYLHAIFPERKAEPKGATITGFIAGEQQTQADAPQVLPEGWDTDLRTQLKGPDPVPSGVANGTARDVTTERGKGLFGSVPTRTLWIGAGVLGILFAIAVVSLIVSATRRRPVIAAAPLSEESAGTRPVPLLPPPTIPTAVPIPSPRPPERATVVLAGRPDRCDVMLDGRPLTTGTAQVEPGRHMLTSQGPGCQAETTELVLAAGDVREIAVRPAGSVTPTPAPPGPTPPSPTPPGPRPAAPTTPAGSDAHAAAGEGTLDLRSRPWAKVYDGGRFLGVSPLLGARIAAGHRTLVLKNPEVGTKRTTVTIRPGRRTSVTVDLSRLR